MEKQAGLVSEITGGSMLVASDSLANASSEEVALQENLAKANLAMDRPAKKTFVVVGDSQVYSLGKLGHIFDGKLIVHSMPGRQWTSRDWFQTALECGEKDITYVISLGTNDLQLSNVRSNRAKWLDSHPSNAFSRRGICKTVAEHAANCIADFLEFLSNSQQQSELFVLGIPYCTDRDGLLYCIAANEAIHQQLTALDLIPTDHFIPSAHKSLYEGNQPMHIRVGDKLGWAIAADGFHISYDGSIQLALYLSAALGCGFGKIISHQSYIDLRCGESMVKLKCGANFNEQAPGTFHVWANEGRLVMNWSAKDLQEIYNEMVASLQHLWSTEQRVKFRMMELLCKEFHHRGKLDDFELLGSENILNSLMRNREPNLRSGAGYVASINASAFSKREQPYDQWCGVCARQHRIQPISSSFKRHHFGSAHLFNRLNCLSLHVADDLQEGGTVFERIASGTDVLHTSKLRSETCTVSSVLHGLKDRGKISLVWCPQECVQIMHRTEQAAKLLSVDTIEIGGRKSCYVLPGLRVRFLKGLHEFAGLAVKFKATVELKNLTDVLLGYELNPDATFVLSYWPTFCHKSEGSLGDAQMGMEGSLAEPEEYSYVVNCRNKCSFLDLQLILKPRRLGYSSQLVEFRLEFIFIRSTVSRAGRNLAKYQYTHKMWVPLFVDVIDPIVYGNFTRLCMGQQIGSEAGLVYFDSEYHYDHVSDVVDGEGAEYVEADGRIEIVQESPASVASSGGRYSEFSCQVYELVSCKKLICAAHMAEQSLEKVNEELSNSMNMQNQSGLVIQQTEWDEHAFWSCVERMKDIQWPSNMAYQLQDVYPVVNVNNLFDILLQILGLYAVQNVRLDKCGWRVLDFSLNESYVKVDRSARDVNLERPMSLNFRWLIRGAFHDFTVFIEEDGYEELDSNTLKIKFELHEKMMNMLTAGGEVRRSALELFKASNVQQADRVVSCVSGCCGSMVTNKPIVRNRLVRPTVNLNSNWKTRNEQKRLLDAWRLMRHIESLFPGPSVGVSEDGGKFGGQCDGEQNCECEESSLVVETIREEILNGSKTVFAIKGPVGCGKTYTIGNIGSAVLSAPLGRNDKGLGRLILYVAGTNAGAETILKTIIQQGLIDSTNMLYLVSRKQYSTLQRRGMSFGCEVAQVMSVIEEKNTPYTKSLRRQIFYKKVVVCTVNLAVGFLGRLLENRFTTIFLDESSQCMIPDGFCLLMNCDAFVAVGDVYQTGVYELNEYAHHSLLHSSVSMMQFIINALEAQGLDNTAKVAFQLFHNYRSTTPVCRLISKLCYPDYHPLLAQRSERNAELMNKFYSAGSFLKDHFGKNKYDVSFIAVEGETRFGEGRSTVNLEECSAVAHLYLKFLKASECVNDPDVVANWSLGIITLHESMRKLVMLVISEITKEFYNHDRNSFQLSDARFYCGERGPCSADVWIPCWCTVATVRVVQGSTFTFTILCLLQSSMEDRISCPSLMRGFVLDKAQVCVSISRQRCGLFVVLNPFRFIMNEDTLIFKMAALAPTTTLYSNSYDPELCAGFSTCLAWCFKLGAVDQLPELVAYHIGMPHSQQLTNLTYTGGRYMADVKPDDEDRQEVHSVQENAGSTASRRLYRGGIRWSGNVATGGERGTWKHAHEFRNQVENAGSTAPRRLYRGGVTWSGNVATGGERGTSKPYAHEFGSQVENAGSTAPRRLYRGGVTWSGNVATGDERGTSKRYAHEFGTQVDSSGTICHRRLYRGGVMRSGNATTSRGRETFNPDAVHFDRQEENAGSMAPRRFYRGGMTPRGSGRSRGRTGTLNPNEYQFCTHEEYTAPVYHGLSYSGENWASGYADMQIQGSRRFNENSGYHTSSRRRGTWRSQ